MGSFFHFSRGSKQFKNCQILCQNFVIWKCIIKKSNLCFGVAFSLRYSFSECLGRLRMLYCLCFRYSITLPPDGQWGAPEGNTFNGMVGQVFRKVLF